MSRVPSNVVTPKAFADLQQQLFETHRQVIRLGRQVCTLDAAQKLRDKGRGPRMPIEFRAQYGEDLLLWNILGGQTEGFYIEVGAFDGYNYAVTYALDAIGWNGLLIEGIPERAEACRQRRPNARVVHAALSRSGATGTTEFTIVQDNYGGMLSHNATNAEHERNLSIIKAPKVKVSVPVTSMDALLKEHQGPIDVAVIDVEGGELDVLAGFDLLKHRPRVLMLEDNSKGTDMALTNYMARQPYVMAAWVEVNRVYIHRDSEDIIERMKWM